ncbi:MAG: hypothetical protein RLZZ453_12 [Chlamydiota bacterium]|jgi:hypothetical protein
MGENNKSPWLTIWFHPKETIRTVINTDLRRFFVTLCIIYGIPLALNMVQNIGIAATVPLFAVIVGALVLSPFVGIAGIYVISWLLHFCGKWIGGGATFQEVRAAVAWSNVPNMISILAWGVLLALFGEGVFHPAFVDTQVVGYKAGVLFLVMLGELIVSVWGFVLLLNTLAETQKFSLWRAFFNIVIPFACVVTLVWLLGFLVYGSN